MGISWEKKGKRIWEIGVSMDSKNGMGQNPVPLLFTSK
jgi:hypothetical protein